MTKSKTYAVVDLEMTTPALDGTGRISNLVVLLLKMEKSQIPLAR